MDTDTSILLSKTGENKRLQKYLQNLQWDQNHFTNKHLASILGASCLRYLGGLEDLSFALELSQKISRRYKGTLKLSLIYATEMLNDLSDKLQMKEMQLTDTQKIMGIVDDAQEVITGIKYL